MRSKWSNRVAKMLELEMALGMVLVMLERIIKMFRRRLRRIHPRRRKTRMPPRNGSH
jgi:hypothetical protein